VAGADAGARAGAGDDQGAVRGTLHELTKLTPIAIIAEALGYATKTIEQHARASATTYTQYVASRHTTTPA
jgi:hypothetical protein